jgi:hypothetical protein
MLPSPIMKGSGQKHRHERCLTKPVATKLVCAASNHRCHRMSGNQQDGADMRFPG